VCRTGSRPPGREADRGSKVQEANGIDAAMPSAPLAGIHPRTRTSSRTAWLSPDGQALGNGTAGRPTAVQFAET